MQHLVVGGAGARRALGSTVLPANGSRRANMAGDRARSDYLERVPGDRQAHSRDEAAARSEVEKAEAREARQAYAAPPPESFKDRLWGIHKACGLDVPRSKDLDAVATAVANSKHLAALAGLAADREILERPLREEWDKRSV
jgi:hypothetical protein